MAIFTAGCIETTGNANEIRNNIYDLARHDLDSPAMKISVRKSPTCINFIAFLPKDKIKKENILKKVSQTTERTVIIFELDYKHVGVVCEYSRILDYILDKPEEFAEERSYQVVYADNADGVELVSFNLDNINREARAGFVSLGFTILLTTAIFFSGYAYMKETKINYANKEDLTQQYKSIVKREFEKSDKMAVKVDMVDALEEVEVYTKDAPASLEQIAFEGNRFCVKLRSLNLERLVGMLPANVKVEATDPKEGTVKYCYEKI